ncbi:Copper transport protein CTR3 [Lachnellula suecica]|uniref:Copper transport protein n=1 Tax=Lachnellula suecica TaxID=602035 RepID=A0A8T9CI80_9HELO|nr:Copper transport protein CTR3 [Lachnellula suecica]
MSIDIDMATSTAMPTSTATPSGMSMGGGSNRTLSMLLNWHTIDACFLSSALRIRSSFEFFLACLAAFLLPIILEFLRRSQRRSDCYLRAPNDFLEGSFLAM